VGRLVKNAGRVVPAPVVAAMEQAAAILAAAAARADALVREGEALRAEARRQGYAEGRDAAASELSETLAAAALAAARVRVHAEPAALRLAGRLAAKMAERIIGRAVETSPETLTELAAQALAASRARAGLIKLHVHPEDRAALERDGARRALLARFDGVVELEILDDATIGRGGCVVETATTRLDARLESQLAALERAVAGEAAP
jgi:flagellar biosynthesis/type III secretory pathway protein FliH